MAYVNMEKLLFCMDASIRSSTSCYFNRTTQQLIQLFLHYLLYANGILLDLPSMVIGAFIRNFDEISQGINLLGYKDTRSGKCSFPFIWLFLQYFHFPKLFLSTYLSFLCMKIKILWFSEFKLFFS